MLFCSYGVKCCLLPNYVKCCLLLLCEILFALIVWDVVLFLLCEMLFALSHLQKHFKSEFISSCIYFGVLSLIIRSVSSAKCRTLQYFIEYVELCKSLIYVRNNSGPNAEPCGTPCFITTLLDSCAFIDTYYCLLLK